MRKLAIYLSLTLLLAVFLQLTCAYDFLYAEQFRLFRFSADYAVPFFIKAGGPVGFLDSFTLQFFAYPYCGAIIVSAMFFLMAIGVDFLLKEIAPKIALPAFGIIIGLMQVGLATETYYSLEQTWAQILTVWILIPFVNIRKFRYLWAIGISFLLYYLTGIFALFAIVLLFIITLKDKKERTTTCIALSACILAIATLIYLTSTKDMVHTWTLDAYYHTFAHASKHSYFVPATLLVAVAAAVVLYKHEPKKQIKGIFATQIIVAILLGGWYFYLCHGLETSRVKKLEVWRWNKDWDRILNEDMPTNRIPLFANYQNLALAAKGRLAEELTDRGQCGSTGLQQVWQGMQQESDLLTDVFMQQGHVAMAQKMAFTAMQGNRDLMHGRMMLHLIETNLILGADKVAEKYINILAQTLFYKDKAEEYRRFIGHPELVAKDTRMGELQRCTRGCNWCPNDLEEGLKQIINANPSYRNALEYLGCYDILNNNQEGFKDFMNAYSDCQGLNPLPKAFAQAAQALNWEKPGKEETE